jgi:hypothetical protein
VSNPKDALRERKPVSIEAIEAEIDARRRAVLAVAAELGGADDDDDLQAGYALLGLDSRGRGRGTADKARGGDGGGCAATARSAAAPQPFPVGAPRATDGVFGRQPPRATADGVLAEWGPKITSAGAYRKVRKVHAKVATTDGMLDTIVGGVCEARMPHVKGDVIMVGSRGGRYVVKPSDFERRYDRDAPEPASDEALAAEGFALYVLCGSRRAAALLFRRSVQRQRDTSTTPFYDSRAYRYAPRGVVWARLLSEQDIAAHFPDGGFTAHWGSIVTVAPNDYLAVPYPDGGEVYVIPGQLFAETYVKHDMGGRCHPRCRCHHHAAVAGGCAVPRASSSAPPLAEASLAPGKTGGAAAAAAGGAAAYLAKQRSQRGKRGEIEVVFDDDDDDGATSTPKPVYGHARSAVAGGVRGVGEILS